MPGNVKSWIGGNPKTCNVCEKHITDAFIDGATTFGPWAIMCPPCHKTTGKGLGAGLGQLFARVPGSDLFVKVAG